MPLPVLPADKANHVTYGLAISSTALGLALALHQSPILAAREALAVTVAAALLKELSDAWLNYRASGDWRVGPHGVEWRDALATACGGLPVWACVEAAIRTGVPA